MTRTPEYEAALDTLEDTVKNYVASEEGLYFSSFDLYVNILRALCEAGRMHWKKPGFSARFVPKPKPLLSEEQMREVMQRAYDWLAAVDWGDSAELGRKEVEFRAYLTSLTQEDDS